MYTLQISSPPSNLRAIFMVKIRINFFDPADDATMAPDGTSSLRAHLSPCPPSISLEVYEVLLARADEL
jgi:hypothetical protein